MPGEHDFIIESHRPEVFDFAYHNHASIEVNYLIGCTMEYSFSGTPVRVPERRMTVFWGAIPHSVTNVVGDGHIVNLYVAFPRVLQWGLPAGFIDKLVTGEVLCCAEDCAIDEALFTRWVDDRARQDPAWQRLILTEIETRIRRMALEPRAVLGYISDQPVQIEGFKSVRQVSDMLQFIAAHFYRPISVTDIAEHVGVSPNYAMSVFRRVVGVPIKYFVTRTRLSHAQMLLATSDDKILSIAMDSGFGSLSSFYEAFQMHVGTTPAEFRRDAR